MKQPCKSCTKGDHTHCQVKDCYCSHQKCIYCGESFPTQNNAILYHQDWCKNVIQSKPGVEHE